jgi:hypothetical protein
MGNIPSRRHPIAVEGDDYRAAITLVPAGYVCWPHRKGSASSLHDLEEENMGSGARAVQPSR